MKQDNYKTDVFFELLRAGLWEKDVELQKYGTTDFTEIMRLAEEQSVVGLITAGLEHVMDIKVPQEWTLQFIGSTLQIEQQNKRLNQFLSECVEKMRMAGIYTLLVKGQGVALCYEKPLWRASGDIDFYMSEENFVKSKTFYKPLVSKFDPDNDYTRHINMIYGDWVVEIHANQHTSLSKRIDGVLDDIHRDLFFVGNVRSVNIGSVQVFMPSVVNDVLIVFTHFLKHFYKGGLGLRQICDWCRLLWTYRDKLDRKSLETRIKQMGLLSEWRAFGAFAIDILGMPEESMPLYEDEYKWRKKAQHIKNFVMMSGNFGHNRDSSYYGKYPLIIRKVISFGRRCNDFIYHARVFPLDSFKFLLGFTFIGLKSALRGEA